MIGNKGEWSEVYVLLKLLSTGELNVADENLNINKNIYYEIINIFREEGNFQIKFNIDRTNHQVNIFKQDDDAFLCVIEPLEFGKYSDILLDEIKNNKTGVFKVEEINDFLKKISVNKLKSPSLKKSDIIIQIHDFNSGFAPVLSFSIKSRLGKPSTLLNASKSTNFTFQVTGKINDEIMNEFNEEKTLKNSFLKLNGCELNFFDVDNETFKNNLMLIDSDLPKICSLMLKEHYIYGVSNVNDILLNLSLKNELNYNLKSNHPFYYYKFKKMITESALGMVPSRTWMGISDANGGYIIVREDGEVLCYHLYNRNEFEDYLINNTKFDTPSRSRHQFAKIYKEDGKYFIKLNMQIRFIK